MIGKFTELSTIVFATIVLFAPRTAHRFGWVGGFQKTSAVVKHLRFPLLRPDFLHRFTIHTI
jgi:hypothetical protein